MRHSPFVPLISLALICEACCLFFIGHWWISAYLAIHGSMVSVLSGGVWDCVEGLLLLGAAWIYLRSPHLRPFLQILAFLGGVYGFLMWRESRNFGHSWNFLQGDLIAVSYWSTALFMALGMLALADLALTRYQRHRRLQAFRGN